MFHRLLPLALSVFSAFILLNTGCTKLDTTTLGTGLIPASDSVATRVDTLSILTSQEIFNDSFFISKSNNNVLGRLNDPVFGTTQANVYLQPQPSAFPYYLAGSTDLLTSIDSVVLALTYVGSWGDTSLTAPTLDLSVFPVKDTFWSNNPYQQRSTKYLTGVDQAKPLGTARIDVRRLADVVKINNGKDSVTNQIRIKLSSDYANALFNSDINTAFKNDTLFRKDFPGLAVIPTGGNVLTYLSLTDARTRLEVYIKKKNSTTNAIDTTFTSLLIVPSGGSATASTTSNYVGRTYPPAIQNPVPNAEAVYLQTAPGTGARLTIPGLSALSNRIIHRAYITVEQMIVDPVMDSIFSPPPYMYLDIVDTGVNKYKPLYYDLNLNLRYDPDNKPSSGLPYFPANGSIDYNYFGGYLRKKTNYNIESVYYYDINVTRYVQQLVTKGTPNYSFRLFPGYTIAYSQYAAANQAATAFSLGNPLALGRIKVKSGAFSDPRGRMKLVIISSELK